MFFEKTNPRKRDVYKRQSLSTTERIQNVEELLAKIGGPFQKGAVGSDAPTVSMRAQAPSRRPTSTLPRIPMEAERKQEEKEEKDGGNKRPVSYTHLADMV